MDCNGLPPRVVVCYHLYYHGVSRVLIEKTLMAVCQILWWNVSIKLCQNVNLIQTKI